MAEYRIIKHKTIWQVERCEGDTWEFVNWFALHEHAVSHVHGVGGTIAHSEWDVLTGKVTE